MVVSCCCSTTSKTWHLLLSAWIWVPDRDALPTSDSGIIDIPSPILPSLGYAACTPFVPGVRRSPSGVPLSIAASAGRVEYGSWPRDCFLVVVLDVLLCTVLIISRTSPFVHNDPTAGTIVSLDLERAVGSSCINGVIEGCKGFRDCLDVPRDQSCTRNTS